MTQNIRTDLLYMPAYAHKDTFVGYTWTDINPCVTSPQHIWLFFVNGLGLPQCAWQPTIDLLWTDTRFRSSSKKIVASTFDRYGQGISQPLDNARPVLHDCHEAAQEIQYMITRIRCEYLADVAYKDISMIVISHSIGVPLTRLAFDMYRSYIRTPPPPVKGYIFLDSNMANVDLVNLLPLPDIDLDDLPIDTNIAELQKARMFYKEMFSPDVVNAENLSRVSLAEAVPASDAPVLPAWRYEDSSIDEEQVVIEVEPLLRVVEHDPETFADEGLRICTRGLTKAYINPAWHEYNLGLRKLDGRAVSTNIVVAAGAGHFIQRDNPRCVADQIIGMISDLS